MAPKKKNTDTAGKVVQVTLSKFFQSKLSYEQTKIVNDEDNSFQVDDENQVKRRKCTNEVFPTAGGESTSSGKSRRRDAIVGGPTDQHASETRASNSGNPSSLSKVTSEKLGKFCYVENDDSQKNEKCFRQSETCRENSPSENQYISNSLANIITVESDEEEEDISETQSREPSISLSSSNITQQRSKKFLSNSKVKKTCVKYTPLEQQFLEIKEKHAHVVLLVECGYKYRFFGEDAEIAAKVLNIFCHFDHNFMTASIPVHRLFVHVRRLVAHGHKVGVVKQTETAHIKASGDNKTGLFTRRLSALYTKATLIGEDCNTEDSDGMTDVQAMLQPNTYLMCVFERPHAVSDGKVKHVGMMCVDPATGDIFYDHFQDSATCTELETRITHFNPVEILLSSEASDTLDKFVTGFAALSSTENDRTRIERVNGEEFIPQKAFTTVSGFYGKKTGAQTILSLDKTIISCLAALIVYLTDFSLEKVLAEPNSFSQFSPRSRHMLLSGICLKNLEIFANATDGSDKGSLFSALNHTVTRFGARLFKTWVAQPLLDKREIELRQNAVHELKEGTLQRFKKLADFMSKLPDIEKILSSAFYRRCSALEFYTVINALDCAHKQLNTLKQEAGGNPFKSSLLAEIVSELPDLLSDVGRFSNVMCEKAAREKDKVNLFKDCSRFPDMVKRKKEIEDSIISIADHRKDVGLTLKQPRLLFTTVQQIEFLIEVKNTQLNVVPSDWTKVSSTKQVSRFHSPFIVQHYRTLNELREQLIIEANSAWLEFLEEFASEFPRCKKAVQYLATLDCLMSLAKTASLDSFCKPEMEADRVRLDIERGFHPIIGALRGDQDQYVPNATSLESSGTRVMVVSGPNMGGKSCYIRQVALITILAQIGCYVPASRARLGIFDAIYTRMGANDNMFKGQSTFMLELQEASDIMAAVTDRSLVILDELGRGTSTHDGVAIAYATLQHFITQCKCLVIFVSHFPLMSEFQEIFPDQVKNFHMAFMLHNDSDDSVDSITFLYQLTEGAAQNSYGMNVAKLANLSYEILSCAAKKSKDLREKMNQRVCKLEQFLKLWNVDKDDVTKSTSSLRNMDTLSD